MKIVLLAINSSYVHTNLAIRCLSIPLIRHGYEVKIIEKNLKDKRSSILNSLYYERADIYGFSTYIWNVDDMLKNAENLKSLHPNCKIIFGGPEVSFETLKFIESHQFIDYIICGEGENALLELCKKIESGQSENSIIHSMLYDNFVNESILYTNDTVGSMLYYESSRGCPYRCAYCLSSLTNGVRAKSVEKTLNDMLKFEEMENKITVIKFVDRTFNFDVNRAKQIWTGLMNPCYTKKYHFEICSSLVDEETLDILSKMPKDKIQLEIGVQSTNNDTLKAVERNMNINKILSNIKKITSFGNMHTHVDLIAGLPYENYTQFAKSFDDTYGICDMLQLGFLKLLKGSKLRENAKKYGYKFMASAPYTVLCNDFLSYEDIVKLEKIEAILERFGNSGKFNFSMNFLLKKSTSAFRFYEKFDEFIISNLHCEDLSKVSQNSAYEILYKYGKLSLIGNENELDIFISYLRFDFLINESGSIPYYLQSTPFERLEKNQSENLKREFLATCKQNEVNIFIPALEVHKFIFDIDKIYFIDRKNKHYYSD